MLRPDISACASPTWPMAVMAVTDFPKSSPGGCLGTCPDPESATGLAATPGGVEVRSAGEHRAPLWPGWKYLFVFWRFLLKWKNSWEEQSRASDSSARLSFALPLRIAEASYDFLTLSPLRVGKQQTNSSVAAWRSWKIVTSRSAWFVCLFDGKQTHSPLPDIFIT